MPNEMYMKFKSNFYWKPATLISLLTVYDCFDPAVTAEQSQTDKTWKPGIFSSWNFAEKIWTNLDLRDVDRYRTLLDCDQHQQSTILIWWKWSQWSWRITLCSPLSRDLETFHSFKLDSDFISSDLEVLILTLGWKPESQPIPSLISWWLMCSR